MLVWQSPHRDAADDWTLVLSAPHSAERYVNYELVDQPGEDILSLGIREGVKELGLHGVCIEEFTVDQWMRFEFVRPAFPHGLRNHEKTIENVCWGTPQFLSPMQMPFIVASLRGDPCCFTGQRICPQLRKTSDSCNQQIQKADFPHLSSTTASRRDGNRTGNLVSLWPGVDSSDVFRLHAIPTLPGHGPLLRSTQPICHCNLLAVTPRIYSIGGYSDTNIYNYIYI